MRQSLTLGAVIAGLWFSAPALATPGDLDPLLGGDGVIRVSGPGDASRIAASPSGGFFVAGTSPRSEESQVAEVWAYQANGQVDARFGQGGRITLHPQTPSSNAKDLRVLPDGDLIVSGCIGCTVSDDQLGFVARVDPDGSLDSTFGSEGVVSDPRLGGPGRLDIDGEGRIVVASQGVVARLLADGTPDATFSGDGFEDVAPLVVSALDVADDDAVVVAGHDSDSSTTESNRVRRLSANGQPDVSFGGGDGSIVFDLGLLLEDVVSVVHDEHGRLVVGASGCTGMQLGPGGGAGYCVDSILRFGPGGDPDPSFFDQGRLTGALGATLSTDALGRILVSGEASPGPRFPRTFAIQRLLPGGIADDTFGVAGTTHAYDRLRTGWVTQVATLNDGSLIALGLRHKLPRREVLLRFSGALAESDKDADGVDDQIDRCEFFYGDRGGGCSRIPRKVSLEFRRQEENKLAAWISAPLFACERRQRVRVLRRQAGRDVVVAREYHDPSGRYIRFRHAFSPGRYYASVSRRRAPGTGICAAARSKLLRVPADRRHGGPTNLARHHGRH